jgi:hypothetical protein
MSDIYHPLNQEFITYLKHTHIRHAQKQNGNPKQELKPQFRSSSELKELLQDKEQRAVFLNELRTHSDIDERLSIISEGLTGVTAGYILGYKVLINAKAIIFSVAMGMGFLAFRLSPQDRGLAREFGGTGVDGLGQAWISVDPWNVNLRTEQLLGDLKYWCEQALAYANELSGTKIGSPSSLSDNAVELLDIPKNVTSLDYRNGKLPSPVDEEIMRILTSVMESTSAQRKDFISLLDSEAFSLLDVFSLRMAMFSVRKNSYEHLLKGLVALAFAALKDDWRDTLMDISLFYYSAVKLGISPKQLFTSASQYATSEGVRKLILGYLDRTPENKAIEQMGYREVNGPSGLIYQFADHPIPDGWL